MPDVLLAVTLFGEGGSPQLCGPAMVKTAPSHTVARVVGAVCRWAVLPMDAVSLYTVHGRKLSGETTMEAAGLASGQAVTAILAAGSVQPAASACAAPFAMLDVEDSELSDIASGLQMAR
jgi:hypothetical protein